MTPMAEGNTLEEFFPCELFPFPISHICSRSGYANAKPRSGWQRRPLRRCMRLADETSERYEVAHRKFGLGKLGHG